MSEHECPPHILAECMTEAGREELLERYIAKWRAYERANREAIDAHHAAEGTVFDPDDDLFLHLIAYFDSAPPRIGDLIVRLADLSTQLLGSIRFGGIARPLPEHWDVPEVQVTTTPAKLPSHPAIDLLNRGVLRSVMLYRRGRDSRGRKKDDWTLDWDIPFDQSSLGRSDYTLGLSVNIDALSLQRKPNLNAVARSFFRIVNEAGGGACFHAFGDICPARDTCRTLHWLNYVGSAPFPRLLEKRIWLEADPTARRSHVRSIFWANYLGPAQAAKLGDFDRLRHDFYSLTCGTVFGIRPLPGFIERYPDGSIVLILRVADDRLCGLPPRVFKAEQLLDPYRWVRQRFMNADLLLY